VSDAHVRTRLTPAAIGIVTIARPDRLNALAGQTLDEMRAAVEQLPRDGARCLLLTGEGRGFSSGADLIGGGGLPEDAGLQLERHFNPLVEAIAAAPVPVVAAVNGPAAGAGASIALMADIVIAARSAYFLQAFVNVGLVPDAGATWILPRLVGRARAMEMMLLGERIPAEQAAAWGMISRVVEDGVLMEEALALAATLARGPTVALGLIRRLVREAAQGSLTDALAAERAAQKTAGKTTDFKAAALAFVQKQAPRFEGR
jgi:2-(1,2-epoxy-1,2-dihydrophenyl)acetyl-CoA isomerase